MPLRRLILLVILCAVTGCAIAYGLVRSMGGGRASIRLEAKPAASVEPVPDVKPADLLVPAVDPKKPEEPLNPVYPDSRLWATGWLKKNGLVVVTLSDGSAVSNQVSAGEEVSLQLLTRWAARVGGRLIPLKGSPRPPPVAAVVEVPPPDDPSLHTELLSVGPPSEKKAPVPPPSKPSGV